MKELVTSKGAAQILGVPEDVVVADVERGMKGDIESFVGQKFSDYTLLYSWQLEGEFLAYHRKRLATSEASAVVGGP